MDSSPGFDLKIEVSTFLRTFHRRQLVAGDVDTLSFGRSYADSGIIENV